MGIFITYILGFNINIVECKLNKRKEIRVSV